MEFKIKENINFNSLVLRKKILGEVLEIIGDKANYTITDLQLYLMIALVDVSVEENAIVYCLSEEDKLMEKLENVIEPIFNEIAINNENVHKLYNDLIEDLIGFMEREHESNLSFAGILGNIIDTLANIDYSKISNVLDNFMRTEENEGENKKLSTEELVAESEKIKELVNKYVGNKNENITE